MLMKIISLRLIRITLRLHSKVLASDVFLLNFVVLVQSRLGLPSSFAVGLFLNRGELFPTRASASDRFGVFTALYASSFAVHAGGAFSRTSIKIARIST